MNPFVSLKDKDEKTINLRKMLADGNDFGLHSILHATCILGNFLYDITPSGDSLFAPTLSMLKGGNPDGTGENSFGYTIGNDTTFGEIGFVSMSSYKQNPIVKSADADIWRYVIGAYCTYSRNADVEEISGLDLDDNVVSKGCLEWLEYWYNNLVDHSLGYSSSESGYTDRFAEDYEVPSGSTPSQYYPDAAHLLSGKIVFYDDTENPNYNNAEYQKVGRFKKGIFKGCASCCNYEVTDRLIDIAEAFCRKYFGLNHFASFGYHGENYVSLGWYDNDGVKYENADKTVFAWDNGSALFHKSPEDAEFCRYSFK